MSKLLLEFKHTKKPVETLMADREKIAEEYFGEYNAIVIMETESY